MHPAAMRVGELAKRTGISVRTLHHYDDVGLLAPSGRSEVGYRLYDADNVVRLQQIRSLRQLGFSLDEIRAFLGRPDASPARVIALHVARLREEIALAHELCARLEVVAHRLETRGDDTLDTVFDVLEVMNRMDKYYTEEQRAYLRERRAVVGDARIHEVEETEWPTLIAQVRDALDGGMDPADPHAQALARRWQALVAEFTGGNAGIQQSLNAMYQNERPRDIHPSMDPRMGEYGAYIMKAIAAAKNGE